MKISEAARISGVTVRTLHHYDAIGLVRPSRANAAGYREYSREDLARLQEVLFFRELDFPLQEIADILSDPGYDRRHALELHRELLLAKRARLDRLIDLIDTNLKGEPTMDFDAFDTQDAEQTRARYAKEARQRWGQTDAYAAYEKKTAGYSATDWDCAQQQGEAILAEFAAIRHLAPDSPQARAMVEKWQAHISEHYYPCTLPILKNLGLMYTADPRFTENIDRHGEGTAKFIAAAIERY